MPVNEESLSWTVQKFFERPITYFSMASLALMPGCMGASKTLSDVTLPVATTAAASTAVVLVKTLCQGGHVTIIRWPCSRQQLPNHYWTNDQEGKEESSNTKSLPTNMMLYSICRDAKKTDATKSSSKWLEIVCFQKCFRVLTIFMPKVL